MLKSFDNFYLGCSDMSFVLYAFSVTDLGLYILSGRKYEGPYPAFFFFSHDVKLKYENFHKNFFYTLEMEAVQRQNIGTL